MHFRQIYCNSLRIKKTQMLLNNNLYKIKYIHYTDFGSAWIYGGGSRTQPVYAGIWLWEALHELDAVFYRCNFFCNDNQYDLCSALFL